MANLKKRIIQLAAKYKRSHVGSALCSVDIIDKIYRHKKKKDIFIASNGHCFLALAVVLEKYEDQNAEELIVRYGVHVTRNETDGIWFSSGSLGHGISASIGFALADPERTVYCLCSDGETMEPEFYGALRIANRLNLKNLKIYIAANGWGGMERIGISQLKKRVNGFSFPVTVVNVKNSPLPNSLKAHYLVPKKL